MRPQVLLPEFRALFAARLRLPLGRLGLEEEADAVGQGLVAVVRTAGAMSPALVPLALELACSIGSLGPNAASFPLCGADLHPDLTHMFTCAGLRPLCGETSSAIWWAEEVRRCVFLLCVV